MKNISGIIRELEALSNDKIIPISVDFDSTVVISKFPNVGVENGNCVDILKRWIKEFNVGIILCTMRDGKYLEEAVNWFKERDIPLYGIGKHPTQHLWTTSDKCWSIFSIDDHNVGIPLINDENSGKLCVDWEMTNYILEPILQEINEKWKQKS